jgi:hypothetical protein
LLSSRGTFRPPSCDEGVDRYRSTSPRAVSMNWRKTSLPPHRTVRFVVRVPTLQFSGSESLGLWAAEAGLCPGGLGPLGGPGGPGQGTRYVLARARLVKHVGQLFSGLRVATWARGRGLAATGP